MLTFSPEGQEENDMCHSHGKRKGSTCMWLHRHRPRSNSLWPHIISSPQNPHEEDTTTEAEVTGPGCEPCEGLLSWGDPHCLLSRAGEGPHWLSVALGQAPLRLLDPALGRVKDENSRNAGSRGGRPGFRRGRGYQD